MAPTAHCRTPFRNAAAALALASCLACAQGGARPSTHALATSSIDTMALRRHTSVLAHDSMGGRGTGSGGARSAATYIATTLRELGLQPLHASDASGGGASAGDYLLPVPLLRANVADAKLTIAPGGTLSHGDGFVVGRVGRDGLHDATGSVARLGSDSAAVTPGAWLLLDRSPGESAARWLPVWNERGAIGLIIRLPSDAAVAGYDAQLGDFRWQLREGPADAIWQPDLPIVMVAPTLADAIARSDARVTFEPHARIDTITDYNVAGVLAGPVERAAPVILTAHYDHLGTVPGLRPDSIYNGFSDNAAGVAMLLAIAQRAREDRPVRPLVFLFPAAEEVGLLGSIHFVRTEQPLVEQTHAVVNLDAGAPPAPPTRWRLAAGTRSAAGDVAAAVVERHGWTHRSDAGSPNSDHWPFVAHGVPAVFLIPDGGFEGVTDSEARALVARWDRYHQPGDEWSADFPFSGLERYAALGYEIVRALSTATLNHE